MKNPVIVSQKNRLDDLFLKISTYTENQELASHWARYLCVLVYGLIEVAMRELLFEYAKRKAAPPVANFVKFRIERVGNWKTNVILDVLQSFDPALRVQLEDALGEELKSAVDSVVANRNKISHGDSVGISFSRIKEYYTNVLQVIEILEQKLNP